MSDIKIGDVWSRCPIDVISHMVTSYSACEGAPENIEPGAVKAMAEALRDAEILLGEVAEKSGITYSDAGSCADNARYALELYEGKGGSND